MAAGVVRCRNELAVKVVVVVIDVVDGIRGMVRALAAPFWAITAAAAVTRARFRRRFITEMAQNNMTDPWSAFTIWFLIGPSCREVRDDTHAPRTRERIDRHQTLMKAGPQSTTRNEDAVVSIATSSLVNDRPATILERNPCELRCRSQDSTMIFSFGKMADGTSCGRSKICINGRCKDVGCDGIIESGVRMDECGVCGGRNLTCVQVQQMSSTQGELYKYMAVTIIPRGATNIRVEDDSHNVLTLWDHWPSRSIAPNKGITNKTIHWESRKLGGGTSTILAGGTSFTHEMAENGSEALTAVGPTMKPVTLAVYLVKKANSSVRYQYWVPKEDNVLQSSIADSPSYLIQRATATTEPPTAEHYFRRARVHSGPLADNAIPFVTDQTSSTSNPDDVAPIPIIRHKADIIQATVLSAEFVDGYLRYDVAVSESYRNLLDLQQREYLWARDSRCPCPRLRVGREYVIMAHEQRNFAIKESKLVVDSRSFVRRFTERRHRQLSRLRKLQGRKCNLTT
ncbi:hypothetical protein HPB50_015066 [Hyalomma asiaticum]|uniref:Uncharacterized protein n=1 Tax=Hyalomma asiaticum TaxID=266040 RepID=A0ACB7SUQ8_HYAAI|nr:hypothetical protein HPB50_015066 [Hyalomma asiaticum]